MRVIVAIDGSDHSEELIRKVAKRRWPIDTEIRILSVVEPLTNIEMQSANWAQVAQGALHKRKTLASADCAKLWQELQQALPQTVVHFEVRAGEAREEIVRAASEWNANLIILGSPGKRSDLRALGTVSGGVMRHAGCSVELVRTPNRSIA